MENGGGGGLSVLANTFWRDGGGSESTALYRHFKDSVVPRLCTAASLPPPTDRDAAER